MPSQAMNGLSSAAILRNSPSRANMANYDEIFAGPEEGHVPTAWESLTAGQNAGSAASALGATPAFRGLRQASEGLRLNQIDAQLGAEADLGSGRPQRIARMTADANNELADLNSEAAYGREELPFATQARDRTREDAIQLAKTRYLEPANVRAEGDAEAARITAAGRVDAANAPAASLPLKGIKDAFLEFINVNKRVPNADEQKAIRDLFSSSAFAAPPVR